jgi:hypothetical protein
VAYVFTLSTKIANPVLGPAPGPARYPPSLPPSHPRSISTPALFLPGITAAPVMARISA